MSIEHKHSYRFVYLKSEKWQNTRLDALVEAGGKCAICGEESISNDAHHVVYPDSFWDTTAEHLVILCRPCHNIAHAFIKNSKSDAEERWSEWDRLISALKAWRGERVTWLEDPREVWMRNPKNLRDAYEDLREKYKLLINGGTPPARKPVRRVIGNYEFKLGDNDVSIKINGPSEMTESDFDAMCELIQMFKKENNRNRQENN